MKLKLLALIAAILMTGTTGAFAQSVNTDAAPSKASTVTSTTEALPATPVSSSLPTASSQKSVNSTVTSTAPTSSNSAVNSSAATSTCPKTTVSGQTVKKNTDVTVNNNCFSAINCLNGLNIKIDSDSLSKLNCFYGINFKTGTCTNNSAKTNRNCNNSKTTTSCTNSSKPANSSSSSKPTPPSSSSKPTTSTSSAPASSSSQGNTSSTPAQSNGSYSAFQNQVLQLVNKERAANGLKALTVNNELNKTATLKSEDMAKLNYFDHTSPTYGSPFDMMKKYGITYRTAGENIAMGQATPEQVMQGWMNSPGHRANILNSSYTQIGVGIAKNAKNQYIWTQQFIG